MADAVTSQTLIDGPKHAVMKFTNVSDGSGESAVKKVDVSALASSLDGVACSEVVVERIWWQCNGMKVQILFDATSNAFCIGRASIPKSNSIFLVFKPLFKGL